MLSCGCAALEDRRPSRGLVAGGLFLATNGNPIFSPPAARPTTPLGARPDRTTPLAMEPTGPPTVFFAGIPAVVMNTLLGGPGDELVNLGRQFKTAAALYEALLGAEANRKIGPGAVFPFAVALTELIAAGVPLDSMWVGGRTGPAYLSDKNPLYHASNPVLSGGDWERIRTPEGGINLEKLAEFIRALPEDTTAVDITAGDTVEIRTEIQNKLDEIKRAPVPPAGCDYVPNFYAMDPEDEAARIGNCVLQCKFGGLAYNVRPPILTIAIGSTTTHVFSLNSYKEIGEFALMGSSCLYDEEIYRRVATPKPPSCIPRSAAFTGFDLLGPDSAVCAASHQFSSAIRKLASPPEPASDESQGEL